LSGEKLISNQMLNEVAALGFDGKQIQTAIKSGEITDATALYQMLYREKIIKQMKKQLQRRT